MLLRKSESRYGKQKGIEENGNFGVLFQHQICYHARAWVYFVDLKYSQFEINHLNNTPSIKAAGGRIYSGVLLKDVKVPVKVRRTLSSVGTSSSNSASEGGSGNLEVFSCNEIRFLLYLYIELQNYEL
jgi:hypothetical protein